VRYLPARAARESAVLELLAAHLPDTWRLYHNVDWEGRLQGRFLVGEWDIIAVAPSGNLAIIEVKAGEVVARGGQLYKRYGSSDKNITHQVRRQHHAMIAKLREANIPVFAAHFLVLPDVRGSIETAGYSKSHVIDAEALPYLPEKIQQAVFSTPENPEHVAAVDAFLRNTFDMALDPAAYLRSLRAITTTLQQGLATTLAALTLPPGGALVVDAVAGAGKTLLASRWLAAAEAR